MMHHKGMFSSYAILILFVLHPSTTFVKSDTTVTEDSMLGEPTCRKLLLLLSDKIKGYKAPCIVETRKKFKNEKDFQIHFQCAVKCYMGKMKMVDDNFALTNSSFETFLSAQVPDNFQPLAHKVFFPCVDKLAQKINPEDDSCQAYGDFMTCLQSEAVDTCSN